MPDSAPQHANEFQRYRRGVTVVYLGAAGVGILLLVASVLRQLVFGSPDMRTGGPRISAHDPNPTALLQCNVDVGQLQEDLGRVAASLVRPPAPGEKWKTGAQWENFSRQWLSRWDEVNRRCRFSELSSSDIGLAYERTAEVHKSLPTMRLQYQNLVKKFEQPAHKLAQMREALEEARREFEAGITTHAR